MAVNAMNSIIELLKNLYPYTIKLLWFMSFLVLVFIVLLIIDLFKCLTTLATTAAPLEKTALYVEGMEKKTAKIQATSDKVANGFAVTFSKVSTVLSILRIFNKRKKH